MNPPADVLWRANSEYRRRLVQVTTYLNLLEQLVLQDSLNQTPTLAALRHALEEVEAMIAEHRDWRYRYYYESADSRRMVQDADAVYQALARFSRMRARHDRRLASLRALLGQLPPPHPQVTQVATGSDLWAMTQFALSELGRFDDFLRERAHAQP